MLILFVVSLAAVAKLIVASATPANCPVNISSSAKAPVVAEGYAVRRIYTGLGSPRSLEFDSAGHLLVVESGVGISSLTLHDYGGNCVGVASSDRVVTENSLNHGLALSVNGTVLYASNSESVFAYPYDPSQHTASENSRQEIVTNMTNTDHNTRTILISKQFPNTLIVSRGSDSNLDSSALNITSGHAQIRSFSLQGTAGQEPYNYPSSGRLWGWGLRNDVGLDVHPRTTGLFSTEASVDSLSRDGVDIHNSNPGEKVNFLGYLNGKASPNTGANFGYPTCVSAWNVSTIPNNRGITRGSNFVIGTSSPQADEACRSQHAAPRLVFEPHSTPLDIKFNKAGDSAFVTLHGSYDKTVAVGYMLCTVAWNPRTGEPKLPRTSSKACNAIVSNQNTGSCTGNSACFRPVGMAFDKLGRLFFVSDSTGEVYIVTRADGSGVQ